MKKVFRLLLILAFTLPGISSYAIINESRITFLNNAKNDGDITVVITFANGDVCTVITPMVQGANPNDKAEAVSNAINIQCPGNKVEAEFINGGVVSIKPLPGHVITKIEGSDGTNQRVNLNTSTVVEEFFSFSGTGTCPTGTALVILDCGSTSSTPTFGKTGLQVATDLAAGLTNCYASFGTTLTVTSPGPGTGEIHFMNLPPNASITFDNGGNCGISESFSITDVSNMVPTLPQWGLIALAVLLLITGIFFIKKIF